MFFERILQKADGTTNSGAFGRAVRPLSDVEFDLIIGAGFAELMPGEEAGEASQPPAGYAEPQATFERPFVESTITRPFRDRAFARHVQSAYGQRCAVTGIRLINGGGRAEVQAAHIRPVAQHGPDLVRNGIALSGTAHWMFDRGPITIDYDYRIVSAKGVLPTDVQRLLNPSGMLNFPEAEHLRPHPQFLKFHRDNVFKD